MTDGYVQAPADNTGKKADATELTNNDGVTVERIRVDVPEGMLVSGDLLELLLTEMKVTNQLIVDGLGMNIDLEELRTALGEHQQ